jgi:RNA polymerase sigma factor for flagellar operon FliA
MATASSVTVRYETAGLQSQASPLGSTEELAITENLPLVRYIAARIASTIPASVELDDLIQTGTLGLIDAVRRYDASKGIPFPAYARYRIRGAILDALRSLDWATRNQRSQNKAAAIARSSEESTEKVTTRVKFFSLGPVVSLSSRRESNDELPAPDVPCAESFHPDRVFEANEAKALVNKAMEALPDRYRKVVVMYYSGDWSMRDIGRCLGVNESRVSQIHKSALGKMKRALASVGEATEEVACLLAFGDIVNQDLLNRRELTIQIRFVRKVH